MSKLFSTLFKPIRALFSFLDPRRDTVQAALIKLIAGDMVKSYLQRNPKTAWTIHEVNQIVLSIRRLTGVKESTAERIVRAVIFELANLAISSDIKDALKTINDNLGPKTYGQ